MKDKDIENVVRKLIIPKQGIIVVKVGTRLLTDENSGIKLDVINSLVEDIAFFRNRYRFIIVSSGAIGLGRKLLGVSKHSLSISEKQALASIGQVKLMDIYANAFSKYSLKVAQILITERDIIERKSFVNAQNTVKTLLNWGVIPIVNENDTVAIDEIRFGDNDKLSALIANLVGADVLIILTTVDGLLDNNGDRVPFVRWVDDKVLSFVKDKFSKFSVGGMSSKLEAVSLMLKVGTMAFIANGGKRNIVRRLLFGEDEGTLFYARTPRMNLRKRWIAYHSPSKGKIYVDEGAMNAVLRNKSLLPSGIERIEGDFSRGDIVSICYLDKEIARGISNYNSWEIERMKGKRSDELTISKEEVVERDNLVVI